jgi:hypothetical protein
MENSLASNLVTRISDKVRDETSWNKILCARKIVEKVVICTFTLEHHEFQREKGKHYFLAASAILFVWVTNGMILPLEPTRLAICRLLYKWLFPCAEKLANLNFEIFRSRKWKVEFNDRLVDIYA